MLWDQKVTGSIMSSRTEKKNKMKSCESKHQHLRLSFLVFISIYGCVSSAPVNQTSVPTITIATTYTNGGFYSLINTHPSNPTCGLTPQLEDEYLIRIKLDTMCNSSVPKITSHLSNSNQQQAQAPYPSSVCTALHDLYFKLCESKIARGRSQLNFPRRTINLSPSNTGDLDKVCKDLTGVLREIRAQESKKRLEPVISPWDKTSESAESQESDSAKNLCPATCLNVPIKDIPQDSSYTIDPACVLLLESYKTYLKVLVKVENDNQESNIPPSGNAADLKDLKELNNEIIPAETPNQQLNPVIPWKAKKKAKSFLQSLSQKVELKEPSTPALNTKDEELDKIIAAETSAPEVEGKVAVATKKEDSSSPTPGGKDGLNADADISQPQQTELEANDKADKIQSNPPKSSSVGGIDNQTPKLEAEKETSSSSPLLSKGVSNSNDKSTSTTAAAVDPSNDLNDLPIPPSGSKDPIGEKTSTQATNKNSISSVLQTDKSSQGQDVSITPLKPLEEEKVVKQDDSKKIDEPIADLSKPRKSKGKKQQQQQVDMGVDKNGEIAVGEEIDDYNGSENPDMDEIKYGKKDTLDNPNQDFGYEAVRKDSRKPLQGLGEAIQYENHGTTINVSLNETEESGFFSYFMFCVIVFGILYIVVHNKKKLIAYVVEGRRPRSRSRRASSSSQYRRLENNFD